MAGEHQGINRQRVVESEHGTDRQGRGGGLGRTAAEDTGRGGNNQRSEGNRANRLAR